jgi:pyruvate,water dikinase
MNIVDFKDCSYKNKNLVGGKNSSLGELYTLSQKLNFSIADGFAITTQLYDTFIQQNNFEDFIQEQLNLVNINNIKELEKISNTLISKITSGEFTDEQEAEIEQKYNELSKKYVVNHLTVAVRSSAIAEDLPNASFAGQQDTYLNVTYIDKIIIFIKKCFASLYNTRAISYRKTHDISIEDVKISVAIQKMVRSDIASAGVAFSIDPESGYDKAIVINSSFGLGELVVSGGVKPDEIICDKQNLKDIYCDPIIMKKLGDKNTKIVYNKTEGGTDEIETNLLEQLNYSITNNNAIVLARTVLLLEEEYCKLFDKKIGIDVEWAIDGKDKKIYILQTRPETIHSNNEILSVSKYIIDEKSEQLISGVAVGDKISSGNIKILQSLDEEEFFEEGDILVTDMTTPDWEPIMKKSAGIITNKGGRTCHAAIVAREMGLNAVVGTSNCTEILKYIKDVTIFCADGEEGIVYKNKLPFHIDHIEMKNKELPIKLMLNVGNPETSFANSLLPNVGVGLARLEFIINNYIKIHPNALIDYPNVPSDIKDKIYQKLGDHDNGEWFFIKRLARGISKIASAFYPNDVIVRFSDFKSNEYKNLIGGDIYEPIEENPMIGWRGASRYYSKEYEKAFELECQAIQYARKTMKMSNVIVMIPFCRTVEECKLVLQQMEKYGLKRGEDGLKVYLMCEIPSNVIEADEFSPYIDGVSIGGNDLLQLTLGVDRDSEKITHLSDNKNVSYRRLISKAIHDYKKNGVKVGFCGQQPSDSVEFCQFLINEGIDSISVTADCVLKTINNLNT